MQLSISDFIAVAALILSAGSVFYAQQALKASRSSNKISLHQPRREIYEALFDFRHLFVELDLHPTEDEINDFYLKVVLPAHIYFSGDLVQRMYRIYQKAMSLFAGINEAIEQGSSKTKWELTSELQDLGKRDLDKLLKDVTLEIELNI
jgi:hypothetical protein